MHFTLSDPNAAGMSKHSSGLKMVKMLGWLNPFKLNGGHHQKWLKRVEDSVCVCVKACWYRLDDLHPEPGSLLAFQRIATCLAPSTDLNTICPKPHLSLSVSLSLSFFTSCMCKKPQNIQVKLVVQSCQECFCGLMWNRSWSRRVFVHRTLISLMSFECSAGNGKGDAGFSLIGPWHQTGVLK